jgi:hypothetical protein
VNLDEQEIHAARMRLSQAGDRLERIKRLPKQTEEQRSSYAAALREFWEACYQDRAFLRRKGITRWPTAKAPTSEERTL